MSYFCASQHLLESLRISPTTPIPDLLNSTFHLVDTKLSQLAATEKTHSGCTAVTVFLRLEDEEGNAVGAAGGVGPSVVEVKEGGIIEGREDGALRVAEAAGVTTLAGLELNRVKERSKAQRESEEIEKEKSFLGGGVKDKIKGLVMGKETEGKGEETEEREEIASGVPLVTTPTVEVKGPAEIKKAAKRTLYTANVGDARAVLSYVPRL